MNNSNAPGGPGPTGNQGPAQAPTPSQPSYAPAKAGQEFIGETRGPESSTERGLWEHLVETGKLTLEEANADRAAEGLSPLSRPAAKTRWETAYDRLEPEVKGLHQYDLIEVVGDMSGTDAETARTTDRMLRETLAAGRFSAESGKTFAKLMSDSGKVVDGHSEEKVRDFVEGERQKLIKIYGSEEAFQEKVALVNEFIDSMQAKAPGTNVFLRESGGLSTALAFSYLANHASMIKARHGRF